MKHLRTLLTLLAVSIGALQGAWARTAPTFPEAQTLESGKTYYLYNVGSDRFLTHEGTSSGNVYARTNQATTVKLSAVNGVDYTIQFVDNGYYLYMYTHEWEVYQNSTAQNYEDCFRVTITGNVDGYNIQRMYNRVETEFFGFDGTDSDRPKPNLTDGNIVWQLFDPDEAARFVAKRNLYRALESAEGYVVDKYEAIYANEESTNDELQAAADMLNDAVSATNAVTPPDWSDYKVLISSPNLISQNWWTSDYYREYQAQINAANETRTLNADVEVDADATLVFEYRWYYNSGSFLEVYLDNELQYTVNSNEGYNNQQRYFVELNPGKHQVSLKFNSGKGNTSTVCYIQNIGVERTPTIIVSLKEPGSLGTEVLAQTDHVQNVRKLIISGEMNDDDWARVLMMTNLFSIDLTDVTNTEIPEEALSRYHHPNEMSWLHSVKLPKGLKKIGRSALNSVYIDEITLPETLEEIGTWVFESTRIRQFILPKSLKTIGKGAFSSNESLTRFVCAPDITSR